MNEHETTGVAVERMSQEPEEMSGLVRLAIQEKVPVEVLERIVALQERVTARNAEMAMAEALSAFQAECPPVPRVGKAVVMKNGMKQYEYRFAPLDEIVRVIRPHLTKHGLSYTHDSAIVGGEVETACTLQHVEGATRKATFRGPVDNSGGKNPLQGVGSARSYGRRYTLVDVLGLTTEEDDDGFGAASDRNPGTITEEQAADLRALGDEVGQEWGKFLSWAQIERLEDLPAAKLAQATRTLQAKRGGK